jgi:uncharacterized membrane protein YfcA
MPVAAWELGLAWAITAAAASLHGTIGFGFALVNVPLLALIDPALAPVPQLLLILPLNAAVVWRERYAVDLGGVGWVLAGRVPGALLGLALLAVVEERHLSTAIALIILLAVLVVASGVTLPRNRTSSFVAGAASGVTGLVAAIGGPPLALLYRSERGATIRASLGTVFALGVVISIVARALASQIAGDDILIAFLLIPAAAAGLWLGREWRDRVEGARLRATILVVSGLASLILLIQSLI